MTWIELLDARIDTCPGCDDWRWDGHCRRCNEDNKTALTTQEAA